MANFTRETSGSFRRVDYDRANDAIDGILAQSAFGQRRKQLERAYKSSEKEYKAYEARTTARAGAVTAQSKRITSYAGSMGGTVRQQTAVETEKRLLTERYTTQQKAIKQLDKDYKTGQLGNPSDPNVYNDYLAKRNRMETKAMDPKEYKAKYKTLNKISRGLQSTGKAEQQQYDMQVNALKRAQNRQKAIMRQRNDAYKTYLSRIRRYNAFTDFEPYSPA